MLLLELEDPDEANHFAGLHEVLLKNKLNDFQNLFADMLYEYVNGAPGYRGMRLSDYIRDLRLENIILH